jgi:hypothetical protein
MRRRRISTPQRFAIDPASVRLVVSRAALDRGGGHGTNPGEQDAWTVAQHAPEACSTERDEKIGLRDAEIDIGIVEHSLRT